MSDLAIILTVLAASLAGDRFQARETADRALASAGWLASPALRFVAVQGDAEARYRAGRLIEGLKPEEIHAPREAEVEDEGP